MGTLAFILLFVTNSVSHFVANLWIGRIKSILRNGGRIKSYFHIKMTYVTDFINSYYHETIIRTGVTCKKINRYM